MKRTRTLAPLTALVCLCVSLTACSPKEVLKSAILKTTTALGLRQETSDEDEVDDLTYATSGGDVTFPETMDTTASKLVSEVDGDALYVAFNGIQNRSTDYFVAGSDSLSITGYATTESTNENFQTFKIALWELSDDKTSTSYVIGSTVYYTTDGTCYQYNVSGMTPASSTRSTSAMTPPLLHHRRAEGPGPGQRGADHHREREHRPVTTKQHRPRRAKTVWAVLL